MQYFYTLWPTLGSIFVPFSAEWDKNFLSERKQCRILIRFVSFFVGLAASQSTATDEFQLVGGRPVSRGTPRMGFPRFCTSSFHGPTRSFAFRPNLFPRFSVSRPTTKPNPVYRLFVQGGMLGLSGASKPELRSWFNQSASAKYVASFVERRISRMEIYTKGNKNFRVIRKVKKSFINWKTK